VETGTVGYSCIPQAAGGVGRVSDVAWIVRMPSVDGVGEGQAGRYLADGVGLGGGFARDGRQGGADLNEQQ
jgi:hypothetical protein